MELKLLTLFQDIVGRGIKLNYSSKRKDNGSQVRYATQIDVMLVYESGMEERWYHVVRFRNLGKKDHLC